MVVSGLTSLSNNKNDFINPNIQSNFENKVKRIRQNGQVQIYQSSYRGSYSTIIRDCIRNAALGRKVLLVQLMKGGVRQGITNPVSLCGNLLWIRSSNSYDQYDPKVISSDETINNSIKDSTTELWEFCKKQLLSGEQDQVILDEIFRSVELGIIDEDDLISTLENRFISGDVILTGTTIPKKILLMADQVTELRS
tara:strand:+ start:768 stop:1355 length:588 start_codon:yes stop_codon:yes gene_type:complete